MRPPPSALSPDGRGNHAPPAPLPSLGAAPGPSSSKGAPTRGRATGGGAGGVGGGGSGGGGRGRPRRPVANAPRPGPRGRSQGGGTVAGSSPEEVGEAGDVARGVARAVRALPEELRQVVKLRYGLDGGGERSARHVGRLLGISDFTVRMRLARARARLSRALDGFA